MKAFILFIVFCAVLVLNDRDHKVYLEGDM